MRKYQQRKILESLQAIQEAQSGGRYADCMDSALGICELIEQTEGNGTRAAALLGEYCELLTKARNGEINRQALTRCLIKIKNSVRYELVPNRIEVVFFPYQLCMWDSMESIYLAAREDPRCDAFVAPIPWFERRPDGSFGKMHYDGDQYPERIPVTDWREYDVEARKPDAVFIHNPYDGNNFVSSVHPDYYSSELKKKTDFLVFIDYGLVYWMPKEPLVGNLLPAAIMSDLFVTYSKEYADVMNFNLKHYVSAGTLPNQILEKNSVAALGSPKFDAVINAKRGDLVLPDEWRKLMDGKIVMLYSTSVGAILQGNENFISRHRAVLETFRNRDDIVLWWRPHPLSGATYASMRPQFYVAYKNLTERYIAGGWGIYDDTPDLHRAIAWSDACYSDESSLLFLYLATGKPFSVRTFAHTPEECVTDGSTDFTQILDRQIWCMKEARGGNVFNHNVTIWWHNFVDANFVDNVRYDNFLDRFIHFVLNEADYPQATLYRQLKLQMFQEFVENGDGTAGQKIYAFTKNKILGVTGT